MTEKWGIIIYKLPLQRLLQLNLQPKRPVEKPVENY